MKPRVMVVAYDDIVARIRENHETKLSGVFAIYQILLGLKTFNKFYYCETDELSNPRPTQPKKK